jgi:hypothetical protein
MTAVLLTVLIAAGDQNDGQEVTTESLFENFSKPPAGYGNVPFYWWVGEPLTREKLLWQLEELADASTSGFAVIYPHTHPDADVELNRTGGGGFGVPVPSSPAFRSKEWWELWAWFTRECAKRNIGVGLDDYVFNWRGNKQWPDEIAALPELKEYKGSIKVDVHKTIAAGETITVDIDGDLVSLAAYPIADNGRLDGSAMVNLLPLAKAGKVEWTAPAGDSDWRITRSHHGAGHLLHPDYGRLVTELYFQRFADHIPQEARAGMNYFFQDELHYPVKKGVWAEDFPEQFRKRKGYDLRPWLIALNNDIGSRTAKIRLDYWDVVMDLAEERYFKPIGEWHLSRGLIYGCDNNGRGRNPAAYGDYFRATSWFGAPGNDAPGHGLALIQTKVSSSIAHLYRRPRVWLEAYHSMGWGASPSFMHESLQRHYVLGANLLSLHGLYYSTFGGWFEWAPPDFHFRMPYWPHMKLWLRGVERMSYLMSHGVHRCDVALLYPTEPLQTGQRNTLAFEVGESMFHAGLDFDFVDSRSVSRMNIEDGQLQVTGECYRALILAGMSSVRFSTLQKALSFFRAGGTVVVVGDIPHASDRIGSDDPELTALLEEILGRDGQPGSVNRNAAGGVGLVLKSSAEVPEVISKYIERDFVPDEGKGHVNHRHIGELDVYMVMDVPQGISCTFLSFGRVELWNTWTGERQMLSVQEQTDRKTRLRIPNPAHEASIIVFSPGRPEMEKKTSQVTVAVERHTIALDGEWESELVPTMNNRWGDFRQPPSNTMIGAEARTMKYAADHDLADTWRQPDFDDTQWTEVECSFGPKMWTLHVPENQDARSIVTAIVNADSTEFPAGTGRQWHPYEFSWRWGVRGEPGSQGYHGLKAKVSNGFLIMGKGGHHIFRSTVFSQQDQAARVLIDGAEPSGLWINGKPANGKTVGLRSGKNDVIILYENVKQVAPARGAHPIDKRTRSAIVFVKTDANSTAPFYPLAMKWFTQSGRLEYEPQDAAKTGCYRFVAPPGLHRMRFKAYGHVDCWVDGESVPVTAKGIGADGLTSFEIALESPMQHQSVVAMRVAFRTGRIAGAAFEDPIAIDCGRGRIQLGDWGKIGVLEHYSGGMRYRRTFVLSKAKGRGKVKLDLGTVNATCEVHVNGRKAGICLVPPYELDISKFVRAGVNELEVLVYGTLANHYQTIPTPAHYRQPTPAGLIGPAKLFVLSTRGGQ